MLSKWSESEFVIAQTHLKVAFQPPDSGSRMNWFYFCHLHDRDKSLPLSWRCDGRATKQSWQHSLWGLTNQTDMNLLSGNGVCVKEWVSCWDLLIAQQPAAPDKGVEAPAPSTRQSVSRLYLKIPRRGLRGSQMSNWCSELRDIKLQPCCDMSTLMFRW